MPCGLGGIIGEKPTKPNWQSWRPDLKKIPWSKTGNWALHVVRPTIFTNKNAKETKLRRTAYLDGLRGFAALLVYWYHHETWSHQPSVLEYGFGHNGQHIFAMLPFVRTLFTGGHLSVAVFFVISGYVLSTKSLSLIHTGEFAKLGDSIGSALFRRWLRLFIPVIATTFMFLTIAYVFSIWNPIFTKRETYGLEVWSWYTEGANFMYIFNRAGLQFFRYNPHTWSIPVEFRGSVVVYCCLSAFSRCSQSMRLGLTIFLMFYFFYIVDAWFCTLFLSGMFICELDLLAIRDELPRWTKKIEPYNRFIYLVLFIFAIYLGGVPSALARRDLLKESFGWYYLSLLVPRVMNDRMWFYLGWSAVIIVAAIPRLSWLKRFFETRFCQYLGRVSYCLYLIHGPIMWTLGERLYAATGLLNKMRTELPEWRDKIKLPVIGPRGLEPGFLVPQLILIPVTFWCAEVCTRLIDDNAVDFAQWVFKKTLARNDGFEVVCTCERHGAVPEIPATYQQTPYCDEEEQETEVTHEGQMNGVLHHGPENC